jgi:hypothetical protein
MKKLNNEVKKRAYKMQLILHKHYDEHDEETSAMDCLADLMHLANVKGWDFPELVRRSGEHEEAERMGL